MNWLIQIKARASHMGENAMSLQKTHPTKNSSNAGITPVFCCDVLLHWAKLLRHDTNEQVTY